METTTYMCLPKLVGGRFRATLAMTWLFQARLDRPRFLTGTLGIAVVGLCWAGLVWFGSGQGIILRSAGTVHVSLESCYITVLLGFRPPRETLLGIYWRRNTKCSGLHASGSSQLRACDKTTVSLLANGSAVGLEGCWLGWVGGISGYVWSRMYNTAVTITTRRWLITTTSRPL